MPRARDGRRDRELLRAIAAGRSEALAELYDRHAVALFRHAMALSRQHADADDLVQAVFVKVATMGAELLGVRTPSGYLHRMLHTAWLDGRRRVVTAERAAGRIPTPSPRPSGADEALAVARALDGLPPLQREVVILHLVEGYAFREVGHLTGVSLFTAASRYRLALRRLRETLGPPGRGTT